MTLSLSNLLTILGLAANLVWLIVNLRIDAKITARIDQLKEWMEERHVSADFCKGCHATADERFRGIERRVAALGGVRCSGSSRPTTSLRFTSCSVGISAGSGIELGELRFERGKPGLRGADLVHERDEGFGRGQRLNRLFRIV
jgi:hypothetical protein